MSAAERIAEMAAHRAWMVEHPEMPGLDSVRTDEDRATERQHHEWHPEWWMTSNGCAVCTFGRLAK